MSSARRSRRYADLVHRAEDGRRDPITVGCWAVVADQSCERPLALALVKDGPSYLHQDGHAIDAVWLLHDNSWRSHLDLTRLDLASVLEEATALLAGIRRGRNPAESDELILRTHRAACLARQSLPAVAGEEAGTLSSLVALDDAIAASEQAWREMVRTRLPNLARALHDAGACELARRGDWEPGEGRPHPSLLVESQTSM